MQIEDDNYVIWKNDFFWVEAIIDQSLWDKELINEFQNKFYKISNEIYKNSDLINPNKKHYISIFFGGEKKIIELNDRYKKNNLPTNVLSFPSLTEKKDKIFLGDIIFSAETIFKEAKKDEKSFIDHLIHLFIHSVLHLLGYDHQTVDSAKIMETIETKILNTLKINNPYE